MCHNQSIMSTTSFGRYKGYGNTSYGVSSLGIQRFERFLCQNPHTQMKSLNFENWCIAELSKIGHHFSNKRLQKLISSKNVNNNKCAP